MNTLSSERGVMGRWRRHSRKFKEQAVERMKSCGNIQDLARELGVEWKLLYTWRWQFEGRPEKNHANYSGKPVPETAEGRLRRENQESKAKLGEKAAEIDFFVAALRRVNRDRRRSESAGDLGSTRNPGAAMARQIEGGTDVLAERDEPGRVLSQPSRARSG